MGSDAFGPKISYRMELDSGMSFEPFVSLEGIWTFEQKNTGVSATSAPGLADTGLRGRGEVGFSLSGGQVGSWSASAFYDGVGDDDFESWGEAEVQQVVLISEPLGRKGRHRAALQIDYKPLSFWQQSKSKSFDSVLFAF